MSPAGLEIRPPQENDRDAVRRVHEQAFGRPDEADLAEALAAAGSAVVSLIAVRNDEVVGHVLFSPVTLTPAAEGFHAVGLGPVAVRPEFQRQGVGTALIRAGLEDCWERGCAAVFVLGHPAYYPRFGFRRAGPFGFGNEYGADDAFMILPRHGDGWAGPAGTVKYAPQFADTGG